MTATSEDRYRRRLDRMKCAGCEATPPSCETRRWLSGRWCCSDCTGHHGDQEVRE